MKFRNDLTAEFVRSLLDYDPETGIFTWKVGYGDKRPKGSVAGRPGKAGYLVIYINRVAYLAHRLAWLWMTGAWPDVLVDHRDPPVTNNAWSNLRAATHGQNRSNSRVYSNNLLGVKGVNQLPNGKFRAVINYGGKAHHLGRFDTIEEASARYWEEARIQFGEYARAA